MNKVNLKCLIDLSLCAGYLFCLDKIKHLDDGGVVQCSHDLGFFQDA